MTLYILKYNNYYNRLVKYESNIKGYEPYIIYTLLSTNFNPADGVDTTHVFGVGEYDGTGDYLIAYENNEIVSKWFITDAVRTRAGQYLLSLHRDLVVDYYNVIKESPMFIEKATLGDGDPLIFNTLNMTFNQIKKSETLLKDETNSAWIIGYMSSKPFDIGGTAQDKISSKIQYHLPVDDAYASADSYPFYKYTKLGGSTPLFSAPENSKVCIYLRTPSKDNIYYGRKFAFNKQGNQNTGILDAIGYSSEFPYTWLTREWEDNFQCPTAGSSMIWLNSLFGSNSINTYTSTILDAFKKGFKGKYTNINNLLNTLALSVNVEDILAENGKRIYFKATNKYYKVRVEVNERSTTEILPAYNSALWLALRDGYNDTIAAYEAAPTYLYSAPTWQDLTGITAAPNSYSFSINFDATKYTIYLDEQPEPTLTYEIQIDNNRWHLNDAPYDMFCIPYSDDLVINNGNAMLCKANKELAFQTALALGRDYMGAGYIYDIQLLPYCPVRECIQADGTFDIQSANHYEIKSYAENSSYINGTVVGTVIFSTRSSFTLDISCPIQVTNKKIQSNCDTWRLCSPNYSGIFLFNAAKNNGVDLFNVDCTYKPYNPYIHINPNFKNLYGYDANDMRGLVCGGDFSLPNVTDSWRTYELNNKNYQNIFDRNIQSMELRNNVQYRMQKSKAMSGILTSTTLGAAAGSIAAGSNATGLLTSAVLGMGSALINGATNLYYGKQLRRDALDLTKDQFGYLLGNIQALPYAMAKTSSFTSNNKIWPFIEYYSCTDTEKLALANKVAYNGMTVMRIGKMSEFIGNTWEYNTIKSKGYIKGKLIRFNDDGEDSHLINSIADELFEGVYIE